MVMAKLCCFREGREVDRRRDTTDRQTIKSIDEIPLTHPRIVIFSQHTVSRSFTSFSPSHECTSEQYRYGLSKFRILNLLLVLANSPFTDGGTGC